LKSYEISGIQAQQQSFTLSQDQPQFDEYSDDFQGQQQPLTPEDSSRLSLSKTTQLHGDLQEPPHKMTLKNIGVTKDGRSVSPLDFQQEDNIQPSTLHKLDSSFDEQLKLI
jgi:hypothetical protein